MQSLHNIQLSDKCLNRHWCPLSEKFTGVDSLLTRLDRGWRIKSYRLNKAGYIANQRSTIHVFKLHYEDDIVTMNVVDNPYIVKVIEQQDLSPIPSL